MRESCGAMGVRSVATGAGERATADGRSLQASTQLVSVSAPSQLCARGQRPRSFESVISGSQSAVSVLDGNRAKVWREALPYYSISRPGRDGLVR